MNNVVVPLIVEKQMIGYEQLQMQVDATCYDEIRQNKGYLREVKTIETNVDSRTKIVDVHVAELEEHRKSGVSLQVKVGECDENIERCQAEIKKLEVGRQHIDNERRRISRLDLETRQKLDDVNSR